MRKLILFLYLNYASTANAADIDSLIERSDLLITGYVLDQRVTNGPATEKFIAGEFDFVIFSICAKPERYSSLLKEILPGDTLKGMTFLTLSVKDTLHVKHWYALPLVRDTLHSSGWRLTDQYYGEGIFGHTALTHQHFGAETFGDTAMGACPGSTNYIYREYGVVEQKFSHKRQWGYTTFTTLDSIVREQWKYRSRGDTWIEWRTEYSASGRIMSKTRIVRKPVGWSSKEVAWIFRDNGKLRFRREKWMTRI